MRHARPVLLAVAYLAIAPQGVPAAPPPPVRTPERVVLPLVGAPPTAGVPAPRSARQSEREERQARARREVAALQVRYDATADAAERRALQQEIEAAKRQQALDLLRLPLPASEATAGPGPVRDAAAALPDYAPTVPPGWSGPIVMRATPDATPGSALDPPALMGDGTSYLNAAFINAGTTAGTTATLFNLQVDGAPSVSGGVGTIPVGATGLLINQPITTTGGLHTATSIADATSVLTESNETNNSFARQFSFTPVNLPVGALVTRAAPPDPLGGTAAVSGTVYPNVDGLRLPANDQPWEGVALRPPAGADYDLRFYDAATGIGNGFRNALKLSQYGSGLTDFILNNGNFLGAPAHDVGVLYYSGSFQSYAIEHRQAPGTTLALGGNYPGLTLASGQMLDIREYQHLPNAAVPRVLFELTGTPGQVLHLALFNPSTGSLYSRSDAMGDAATDATGRAYLDMALETSGQNKYYGVVVYRDQLDGGTAPATFTLRIRQTPADLSNAQAAGFTVPVNASNAGGNITTEPTALDGNTPNTAMAYYYQNLGTQTAASYNTETRLDGVGLAVFGEGPLAAGGLYGIALGPLTVRGGRHTLSYQVDINNSVDEVSEANNQYGKQFVWSPLSMTQGVPLTRAMPPDPQGGWSDIPNSVTKYPNLDGLREDFLFSVGSCVVTAVVPGAGSDVDLDWFPLSTGPSNGFTTPLVSSARAGDVTDLLVDCYSGQTRRYDIGVRKFLGTNQPYTIQTLKGSYLFNDPIGVGPVSIAPNEIVSAYQFNRSLATPLTVVLENLSGSADLGMCLYQFGGGGPVNMGATLPGGFVDGGGPGSSEVAVINQDLHGQSIGIVVWKHGAADLGKNASFRLLIDPAISAVDTPPPVELAFSVAGGNPLRGAAQLSFALPASSDVALEVVDVLGRRVRTLVDGPRPAGAQVIDWDGADAQGRPVASGTYFVRFATAGFRRVLKVSVLR